MTEDQKATSPDGRFVATLSSEYFQTLGFMTEDMNATVEVRIAETGELVLSADYSFVRNKRGVESGREVKAIEFDGSEKLLTHDTDKNTETLVLPAPGELSATQAVNRTAAALALAFPERAPLLIDAVTPLFWIERGHSDCDVCRARPEPLPLPRVCRDCERLFARRLAAAGSLPGLGMAVAEVVRAVETHAADAAIVTEMVSSRAARVPDLAKCNLCGADPAADPLDLWSPVGRACAGCIRKFARG